jgi:Heterokaryon incompatibility protein (HET)
MELRNGKRFSMDDAAPSNRLSSSSTIYQPLPDDGSTIRLLTLLPAANNTDGIECMLSPAALSQSPIYNALSYTWDIKPDSTSRTFRDEKILTMNQQYIKVRENLWQFLLHLRGVDTSRVLWADALCINQEDIPERNRQVQLMSKVYRQADSVLAWLGLEADGSVEAFTQIRDFPENSRFSCSPSFALAV